MLGIHRLCPCIAAGESGLGKTTLINTLFATELSPPKNYNRRHVKQLDKLTEVPWPLDPRSLVAALSDTTFCVTGRNH
jgi:hypothetical protein